MTPKHPNIRHWAVHFFLWACLLLCPPGPLGAVVHTGDTSKPPSEEVKERRKPRLKERILMGIFKRRIKRQERKQRRKMAKNKALAQAEDEPKTHWAASVGIGLVLLGLLTFGISAFIGLLFSIRAVADIHENPKKYKGMGLAVAGIVFGIIIGLIGLLMLAITSAGPGLLLLLLLV